MEKCLRAQGFKGNPYRLLHGDTKEMADLIRVAKSKPIKLSDDIVPRVLPLHHHIIKTYGKASYIWIGPVARLIILDPQLIKEILNNNGIFKKPIPNPLAKFLVSGLSGYEDEKWAKHRKIINPAFYLENLKKMVPAMRESCMKMIRDWEERIMGEDNERVEMDVGPHLSDLGCDLMLRTAFGGSDEEGLRIFQLQKEQAELTRQVLQSVYIPGWRFVPTKRNRRLKVINTLLCTSVKNIIKQRELKREEYLLQSQKDNIIRENNNNNNNNDLLGLLLKSNNKQIQENGKAHGITIDEVVEECKNFYLSGHESISNLLLWTMLMLAIHRDWQERAREEVFRVFGHDEPDFDGLSRLKIVTMILYEVLRLYPPAVIFNRTIHRETKLAGITLPAGVHLLLPVILIHHDPELWGRDVKEFKPERFSQGVAKATQNRLSFFPFSWGPRNCIANNFTLMETKVALALILARFSFELSPSYIHAPSYVVTLQPQFGVHLMLTRIRPDGST
ncbi:Cytochrome P450 72A14 [Striga hermonthica]|uniref:Cytochrome P450 72A14 n=1 Tax=Striga hermonthica TaxID=68872 RepID=A0A9N7MNJ4_STRHE|nr:Cytochrome P450 72A14 [Striga hermonthica]